MVDETNLSGSDFLANPVCRNLCIREVPAMSDQYMSENVVTTHLPRKHMPTTSLQACVMLCMRYTACSYTQVAPTFFNCLSSFCSAAIKPSLPIFTKNGRSSSR